MLLHQIKQVELNGERREIIKRRNNIGWSLEFIYVSMYVYMFVAEIHNINNMQNGDDGGLYLLILYLVCCVDSFMEMVEKCKQSPTLWKREKVETLGLGFGGTCKLPKCDQSPESLAFQLVLMQMLLISLEKAMLEGLIIGPGTSRCWKTCTLSTQIGIGVIKRIGWLERGIKQTNSWTIYSHNARYGKILPPKQMAPFSWNLC